MNDETIIKLQNVSFSYGTENVLDDINFSIKKGDFVGIIGPNGSGKTTLLRVILNLITPQTGSVEVFGKIGYVPQKATQFEARFPITVDEVVSLGRISEIGFWGKMTKRDFGQVSHQEDEMDIKKLGKRKINELSGGQQQRVFIAKALVSNPDILILDEPTTGVDIKSQESFYNLLEYLNKEKGLTIILVSHDIGVVVNEVKTLFCINKSLIYHGEPKNFTAEKNLKEIYGKDIKLFLHGH